MQSQVAPVKPGDVVYGNVTWDATTGTYTQQVGKSGSKPIVTKVTKVEEHSEVFTDVYVVVEHQPNSCAEVRGRRGSARAGGRTRARARAHARGPLPSRFAPAVPEQQQRYLHGHPDFLGLGRAAHARLVDRRRLQAGVLEHRQNA